MEPCFASALKERLTGYRHAYSLSTCLPIIGWNTGYGLSYRLWTVLPAIDSLTDDRLAY